MVNAEDFHAIGGGQNLHRLFPEKIAKLLRLARVDAAPRGQEHSSDQGEK
jgi:hypothetical protein